MMLLDTKRVPGSVRWAVREEVLAPILVLALFVCHGAFGAMHQVMPDAGSGLTSTGKAHSSYAASSQIAHGGEGEQNLALESLFSPSLMDHAANGGTEEGSGVLSHAAALLFTVAVVFWSLLKGIPGWRAGTLPEPLFRKPYPMAALPRSPAPAISALQVFRL